MSAYLWFVVCGLILVSMAIVASFLKHLPLSSSILYLLAGLVLGPLVLNWLNAPPLQHTVLLEHLTELAVIISLFTAGLKLRLPLTDGRWRAAFRLAFLSMIVTVGLVACVGHYLLGLTWGAAVILGAVLAPTDPVLASDVQVQDHLDRDRLRLSLTGEAGLNDGTAFPFVMLGLGLMGLHDIGPWSARWFAVDLLWAVSGGLGIGALLGLATGWLFLHLRARYDGVAELYDFLSLGLIALSYGVALALHTYGFLAVFAAAVALRQLEIRRTGRLSDQQIRKIEEGPEPHAEQHHPLRLTSDVLTFNEQLERIAEVAVVTLLGAMLWHIRTPGFHTLVFISLLLLLIRPVAVFVGLAGTALPWSHRAYIGWFGIRGVGSLYYLFYAINHGPDSEFASRLIDITFTVVTVSIVAHGTSVTPLMKHYRRRQARRTSPTG